MISDQTRRSPPREWGWARSFGAPLRRAFSKRFGLVGCGVGLRLTGGCLTSEPCVIACVRSKRSSPHSSEVLPAAIELSGRRVGVDVVGVGTLARQAFIGQRLGPDADPGEEPRVGTLGAIGTDREQGGAVGITAMHVVGGVTLGPPHGVPVYAPSKLDDPDAPRLGVAVRGTTFGIDAAKIRLDRPDAAVPLIPGASAGRNPVSNWRRISFPDDVNCFVTMRGGRSGLQEGLVVGDVDLPGEHLTRAFTVMIPSASGDSGAGLVDRDSALLGLLVGRTTDTDLAVFTPIDLVLSMLRCSIP
jgi:hypothetical protein